MTSVDAVWTHLSPRTARKVRMLPIAWDDPFAFVDVQPDDIVERATAGLVEAHRVDHAPHTPLDAEISLRLERGVAAALRAGALRRVQAALRRDAATAERATAEAERAAAIAKHRRDHHLPSSEEVRREEKQRAAEAASFAAVERFGGPKLPLPWLPVPTQMYSSGWAVEWRRWGEVELFVDFPSWWRFAPLACPVAREDP